MTARTPGAAAGARSGPPTELLALQATVGNDAVLRMLRRTAQPVQPAQPAQLAQPTQPGERHQQGAGPAHPLPGPPPVQRRSTVHEVLRSAGKPLDDATRTDMEARLGADFSDVRVHDDSAARASAAEVGARAYTSGSHIVIGDGGADRHTFAHELTHVVQQRQGPVAGTDDGRGLKISDPADRFEREAEANARRVLSAPVPDHSTGRGAGAAGCHDEMPDHAQAPDNAHALGNAVQRLRDESRPPKVSKPGSRARSLTALNEQELQILSEYLAEITHGDVDLADVEKQQDPNAWFTIEFNGWTLAELSTEVEKNLKRLVGESRAFSVRSRAVHPAGGIVFTDDVKAREIARRHTLTVGHLDLGKNLLKTQRDPQFLEQLDEHMGKTVRETEALVNQHKWVLRTEATSDGLIYYGPTPASRAPHQNPAKPKDNLGAPPRPANLRITQEIKLTGPCARGDESQTRARAMGNYSALNYAKKVGFPDADTMRWEWLHVIGSAIGGGNEAGNLVAGTFDSNTQMTMLEGNITKFCKDNASPANPVTVRAEAVLLPDAGGSPTYIANQIRVWVTQGGNTVLDGTFRGVDPTAMDRMQYDYYQSVFNRQFQPAEDPWQQLVDSAL
ncbi:DUF4157 domain-containing protein [Streptomyces sp. 71268]|uniref:eCIS core domain-containing protein n=1 Tax=Streptomyces sp. 71268 TaxID=3002640 RepID=UPI0023F816B9|nr:DUF4157 domain-containing protein [Streptomyces sp. 71268]WEV24081.1 DUF4157 domain-containing protein [Streptomyces sp. 71268]